MSLGAVIARKRMLTDVSLYAVLVNNFGTSASASPFEAMRDRMMQNFFFVKRQR